LILNALVTYFCGSFVLYQIEKKRVSRHVFYFAWSIGFILYGTQLALRAFTGMSFLYVQGILMVSAFSFFILALWSLNNKRHVIYLTILIISLSFVVLTSYHLNYTSFATIWVVGSFLTYLPVIVSVLYHRAVFGENVDKFVFGWFLLFITNIILPESGWIADTLCIFSKVVILLGIMDYDFVLIINRIHSSFASSSLPVEAGYGKEGALKLILCSSSLSFMKVKWIRKKVKENLNGKSNTDTYIFCFQDTIPHKELRSLKWIDPEKVFIFVFSSSAREIEREFTVLSMGILEVGSALSEVIKKNREKNTYCDVIFNDISILINIFGVYPTYNMILNKLGAIRESGINLYSFLHPSTLSDGFVVPLFENISDEILKL